MAPVAPPIRRLLVVGLLLVIGLAAYQIVSSIRVGALRSQLSLAVEQRRFGDAERLLGRCFQQSPQDPHLHLVAAQLARRQGDLAEMNRELGYCRANGGSPDAIEFERRLAEIQAGDFTQGARFLEFAHTQPETLEGQMALEAIVVGSLAKLDVPRARRHVKEWKNRYREDANQAQAFHWEGMAHELNGESTAARESYRAALQVQPEHRSARLALVDILSDEEPQAALELISAFPADAVGDREVRLRRARIDQNLGNLTAAETLLDELLKESPDDVDLLVARGRLALASPQPSTADSWLRRADRLSPKHRGVLLAMIEFFRATGNTVEAERYRLRMVATEAEAKRALEQRFKSVGQSE